MQKQIQQLANSSTTFSDIICLTCEIIKEYKLHHPYQRIGYISGKVTADGILAISKNLSAMNKFTTILSHRYRSIVFFSAADIFPSAEYWRNTLTKVGHKSAFYTDWRKIIACGVTDIYMMPNWKLSKGATDERTYAAEHNITIHEGQ